MMKGLVAVLVALVCVVGVYGDVYMHNPRGSNNRLNEQTANRDNGNRLFDSQNNNKGGYNVGDTTDQAATTQDEQFAMTFYESSKLHVTWTNQHGCGGESDENGKVRCEIIISTMCSDDLRNGINTGTPNEQDTDKSTGLHETPEYYDACKNTIQRNQGLFTADQNLQGDTAIYTRQNPNGDRSGLECPEERDYFPWWHPNPWKHLAVLSYNRSRWGMYKEYLAEHQPEIDTDFADTPWTRDNHLGNGRDGFQVGHDLYIPSPQNLCGAASCKCVLRIRYNISTSDYPWDQDASLNGDELSPIEQNPVVDIGVRQGLKLAINTAQTGRTFQDRSHIFRVEKKPSGISGRIHNWNVMGKRGNIVQTYPAVEYDFCPNTLRMDADDYVHIQWAGSNTHNNNAPAGDGQAGDDGEGTGGTDRSNFVQILDLGHNYPLHLAKAFLWEALVDSRPKRSPLELALELATAGGGLDTDDLLNNAPASHDGGLMRFQKGTYHMMCTRNNNFSNRSQKGTLVVG